MASRRLLPSMMTWNSETADRWPYHGEPDARVSVRDQLQQRLRDYLAIAEGHGPDEKALAVRSVAAALGVSPTTLYKYGFNNDVNAAEQRQRENGLLSGAAIEQRFFEDQLVQLKAELERNKRETGSSSAASPSSRRMPEGWASIPRSYTEPF